MDKKVVLISGASRGIGAAIAMHLASLGYKVIGTARSEFKFDKPSDNLIPLLLCFKKVYHHQVQELHL